MRCRSCDYVLANLTTNRCPECGGPFDPARPSTYRDEFELTSTAWVWWLVIGVTCVLAAIGYLILRFLAFMEHIASC